MREREYRRKRQIRRQRRLLVLGGGLLTVVALLWNVCQAFPRNTWIDIPDDFYKPDMISHQAFSNDEALKPLPAKHEDAFLRQKLEQELAAYPQTLKPHLYYFNLQNYSYVDINGSDPVPAASVIKLPILLEYLRQMDQGSMASDKQLLYQNFEQASGSGSLQYKPPGQPIPAQEVAAMMIQSSDNTCTNMLIYHLGGADTLNKTFEGLGLHGTHVSNWLPDLGGTNVVSMQDNATILYNMIQGDMLSWESKAVGISILKGTHNRRLLPALLPKDTLVAHKTGDIGTSLGNSGLFILPNGQQYIVAIQVERPYNDYTAKEMIQRVSKVIYDDVTSRPALANSSL